MLSISESVRNSTQRARNNSMIVVMDNLKEGSLVDTSSLVNLANLSINLNDEENKKKGSGLSRQQMRS